MTASSAGEASRDAQIPFFAALCLFLSAVEYAIPKPLPFMRLGLANLPILISLAIMRRCDVVLLIALKVIGQALISGTLFSYVFLFSAAGSFASGFAMILLYALFNKTGRLSNVGLSLGGALANNAAQVAVARMIIFGENTRYLAPLLFATGIVTGLVLGIFANVFCKKSSWYNNLLINKNGDAVRSDVSPDEKINNSAELPRDEKINNFADGAADDTISNDAPLSSAISSAAQRSAKTARMQFIVAMILFPIFLLHQSFIPRYVDDVWRLVAVWSFVAVFVIMAAVKKHGKIKLLPSLFMTLGVTFFALLTPAGKVLFSIGSFRVTLDSLFIGLRKSGILVGMVFLSQFAISPRLNLPGKAGAFLSKMFAVFDALTAKRLRFTKGHVIATLDARLAEASELITPTQNDVRKTSEQVDD